jgi:energy-coupling factor transporter ATP-binding protein EcfA2
VSLEATILKELGPASGGLLTALVKALAVNSDRRIRGTKFERQLQKVVSAAIASAAASSASKPADELGDHAVAVLVTHTSISDDLAAAIVVPPGSANDTVEESWVAGVRDRLIEGGVDPETLPIDLEFFIRTLSHTLLRELEVAGNKPETQLGHLVTHVKLARAEAAMAKVPQTTALKLEAMADAERRKARTRQLADLRRSVRSVGEALPYLAIRSRLSEEGTSRTLSAIYMTQQLEECSPGAESLSTLPLEEPDTAAERSVVRGTSFIASVREVTTAHERVTVVGAGGQGKSTLLHHICATLDDASHLVPVLVSAQQLAAERDGWPNRLSRVLAKELRLRVEPSLFEGPPGADASWLLLVDGLDEVLSSGLRGDLVDDLIGLANTGTFRVVVSSRDIGDIARLEGAGFRSFVLSPVSVDQSREFARAWFSQSEPPQPERGDELLDWLESNNVPYETSPLLLTMAALLFERPDVETGLKGSRVEVYEDFIEMLLNDEEASREAYEMFERGWRRRVPGRGSAVAARLWEQRRALLEHLACWRQDGNTGDLVSEALSYVRQRDLVPRDLQRRWLRKQTRTLLQRTGLVAGPASLEFVHETLREYLAGSALAQSMSPDDSRARALLDDTHLAGRSDVLAFAIYVWAAKGDDVGNFLRYILEHRRDKLFIAQTALADGAAMPEDVARAIGADAADEWLFTSRISSVYNFGLHRLLPRIAAVRADVRDRLVAAISDESLIPSLRSEAVGLVRRLLSKEALHEMLADGNAPVGVRIESARGLLEASDTARVEGQLLAMRDEASAFSDRAAIAVLLSQIGGPPLAVEALLGIGRDPSAYSSATSDSVAEGLIKLGHLDELSDLAHDSRLFSFARLHYAEHLLNAGAPQAALSAARAVAKGEDMHQLTAAGIIGRAGHTSEALAVICDALTDGAPFGSELETALHGWATVEDVWQLACNDKFGAEARITLAQILAGTEFSERAVALLRSMAGDTALDDHARVDAAMALALMDDETHSRSALESIARDATADAVARGKAVEAVWSQDAPSDSATTLLEILRDPGLGPNRCKTLARLLGQLDRQDALLGLVNDPLIEARTRLDIARAIAGFGMRDEALAFLWDISRSSNVALRIQETAISILVELGQKSRLLKWAGRESTPPSARLAVAKALVNTPARDSAARLVKRAIEAAAQLNRADRFGAAALLADAGDPSLARQLALDPQVDEAVARGAIFALRRLERVGDLREIAGNVGLPADSRLDAAKSLKNLGRTEEAAAVIRNVMAGYAAVGRPLLERAFAYERMNLFDEAAVDFDTVAQDRALDSELRCLGAMGLSRVNRVADAEQVLSDLLNEPATPPKVAVAAAKTLGELGFQKTSTTSDAVALLWRCVLQDERPSAVREAAANALGTRAAARILREAGLHTEILRHVASDDLLAELRVALTGTLVELDEGPRAGALLASIAADERNRRKARCEAIGKLWKLRDPMEEWREPVRKAASASLRALRAEPGIAPLFELVVASAAM